jgi:hypothetical protein
MGGGGPDGLFLSSPSMSTPAVDEPKQQNEYPLGRDVRVVAVDYLVCPKDGDRVKALSQQRPVGEPLIVSCPTCGERFVLKRDGLAALPPTP